MDAKWSGVRRLADGDVRIWRCGDVRMKMSEFENLKINYSVLIRLSAGGSVF